MNANIKQRRHCMPQWFNYTSGFCCDKRNDERKKLMRILQDGEDNGKYYDENYALEALKQFYIKISKAKIEKQYFVRSSHLSYLRDILKVKEALMKKDYVWTCHELCDIIHNEDIFQTRIKNNIMSLLEIYIVIGENICCLKE